MSSIKSSFVQRVDGGLNVGVFPQNVKPGQMVDLLNFRPENGGLVQTDPLVVKVSIPPINLDNGDTTTGGNCCFLQLVKSDSDYCYLLVQENVARILNLDLTTNRLVLYFTQVQRPNRNDLYGEVLMYGFNTTDFNSFSTSFQVQIQTSTTFRWRKNIGSWVENVPIDFEVPIGSNGLKVRFMTLSGYTPGDTWKWVRTDLPVSSLRIPHTAFVSDVYLAHGSRRILRFRNGQLEGVGYTPVFGKYVCVYQNHLVVAQFAAGKGTNGADSFDSTITPWQIAWSDLNDPDQFYPTDGNFAAINEADFYSIPEITFPNTPIVGITGLETFGGRCYIFLTNAIWAMQYVGFPNVMQLEPVVEGIGNIFSYSLIKGKRGFYFISSDNFYFFDGSSMPVPIGEPVKDLFFDNLLPYENEKFDNLFGFYDEFRNEVVWTVFEVGIKSETPLYKTIQYVYQEVTNKWFLRVLPNSDTDFRASYINYIAQDYGNYKGLLYAGNQQILGHYSSITNNVSEILLDNYSGASIDEFIIDGEFIVQQNDVFLIPGIAQVVEPFFETGDFYFDDVAAVKEIESLLLDAWYDTGGGIDVWISTRDFLSQPIRDWTFCQLFTTEIYEKRLSLPRLTGRIFRLRMRCRTGDVVPTGVVVKLWQAFIRISTVQSKTSPEK